jgi:hypothetical protein
MCRSPQIISKQNNAIIEEEFEDTKGAIRIRNNRQHNGHKKKYKRINNDLQNIIHKTKRSSNTNPSQTWE